MAIGEIGEDIRTLLWEALSVMPSQTLISTGKEMSGPHADVESRRGRFLPVIGGGEAFASRSASIFLWSASKTSSSSGVRLLEVTQLLGGRGGEAREGRG